LKLIGLEKEYFMLNTTGGPVAAKQAGISEFDECGYLAEARGEPKDNIVDAVYSLRAAEYRLYRQAEAAVLKTRTPVQLVEIPYMKLKPAFLNSCARSYGKNPAQDQCLYSNVKMKNVQTAGLHIHFSNRSEVTLTCRCGISSHYSSERQINIPNIIKALDGAFSVTIFLAKRQPGLYEMKPHGFEYRSLPNNVDLDLLIKFFADNPELF